MLFYILSLIYISIKINNLFLKINAGIMTAILMPLMNLFLNVKSTFILHPEERKISKIYDEQNGSIPA